MNKSKQKAQKVTPGFGRMNLRSALDLRPSEQRQRYLDEHDMSVSAQTQVHNNPSVVLDWTLENLR